MNTTQQTLPLYKTEFSDFDDLTTILEQLPVRFIDHSWVNDSCPNFQFAATVAGEHLSYPRLVLWIDYADPAKREIQRDRFMLQLVRCEEDLCSSDLDVIETSEELAPIIDAIKRVTNDGITMRLYRGANAEGLHCLFLSHNDTAIENPFLSECGRFEVSPSQYGLDLETGSVFLNAMPMDQLRDVISNAIGNTDVFDSLATDAEKREFAVDYLAETLHDGAAAA